jgi:hypothetical protein
MYVLPGRRSADDEVTNSAREEPPKLQQSFARQKYGVSRQSRYILFIIQQTFFKNNLSCVNNVTLMCISFIINVIVIAEKRIGGITVVPNQEK